MTDRARELVERASPPPLPNPSVRHGARRSPEDEALAFLRANRDTHSRWAEYFEKNPDVEAEYLSTGVWEGAADQRRLEREYNAAIATFERLIEQSLTPPEGDTVSDEVLLNAATPEQINRANDAVFANLDEMGVPKYDSAFGYACALTAIIQSDAALQSRVSPQAGMREALVWTRNELYLNMANQTAHIIAKIDAALSTAPIPMSEDAKGTCEYCGWAPDCGRIGCRVCDHGYYG